MSKGDLYKQNGEWWFLDLWKSTSKVNWIHEVKFAVPVHSDNSFSFTDIQPCFKFFFLRYFKSRCNTTLQWYDTRFKVWQKIWQIHSLVVPCVALHVPKNRIKFNSFYSCCSGFILKEFLRFSEIIFLEVKLRYNSLGQIH